MLGSSKPVVDRLRETATPTRLLYPRTPVGASAGQAVTFLSCARRSDDTEAIESDGLETRGLFLDMEPKTYHAFEISSTC